MPTNTLGTIKEVEETSSSFKVIITITDPPPPPAELVLLNPPDWCHPIFRANVGKTVDVAQDGAGLVTVVKVSA